MICSTHKCFWMLNNTNCIDFHLPWFCKFFKTHGMNHLMWEFSNFIIWIWRPIASVHEKWKKKCVFFLPIDVFNLGSFRSDNLVIWTVYGISAWKDSHFPLDFMVLSNENILFEKKLLHEKNTLFFCRKTDQPSDSSLPNSSSTVWTFSFLSEKNQCRSLLRSIFSSACTTTSLYGRLVDEIPRMLLQIAQKTQHSKAIFFQTSFFFELNIASETEQKLQPFHAWLYNV